MARQIAKKVKDVNLAEAKEKERVLQLYSFKMVEEAENIKNNTEKGLHAPQFHVYCSSFMPRSLNCERCLW